MEKTLRLDRPARVFRKRGSSDSMVLIQDREVIFGTGSILVILNPVLRYCDQWERMYVPVEVEGAEAFISMNDLSEENRKQLRELFRPTAPRETVH